VGACVQQCRGHEFPSGIDLFRNFRNANLPNWPACSDIVAANYDNADLNGLPAVPVDDCSADEFPELTIKPSVRN
jgi:hypothetical protein